MTVSRQRLLQKISPNGEIDEQARVWEPEQDGGHGGEASFRITGSFGPYVPKDPDSPTWVDPTLYAPREGDFVTTLPAEVNLDPGPTTNSIDIDPTLVTTSNGLVINLMWSANALAAPQAFRDGIQAAADVIQSVVANKVTLNISVDYTGSGGGAWGGPTGYYHSYSSVRTALVNNATAGDTIFATLPDTASINGQANVAVWRAQEKIFGWRDGADTTTADGVTSFATGIQQSGLIAVALHELTHAMGRINFGPAPGIFDLFRFTGAGVRLFESGVPASTASYFSVDGGVTKLADYGISSDASDFLNSGVQGDSDPFNEYYIPGYSQTTLTWVDILQLDALGYRVMPGDVSISDVSITEGNSGTSVATFTVTRTGGISAFSVNYATANGTAIGGSDYLATSGTLSFASGVTTRTISVTINGDIANESEEAFYVNLSGATFGARIADAQGSGAIVNDDFSSSVGSVAIGDATITEGDSGTKVATFTVTRTGGVDAFSIAFATVDGTATAGSDYVATSGTLTFGAGVSTQTISVTINGDIAVEGAETFFVDLSSGTNGVAVADARGLGTITNDDIAGSVTIGDVTIVEGDSGTKIATFTVTRAGGSASFAINYATADGAATAGSDYTATSGTLNFAAGVNTQTISVTIRGDSIVEANETFFINLSGGTNGVTIADAQGLGTITNDDAAGSISISDVTIAEGDAGTKVATFTVTRVGGSAAFGVNYATADGAATAGSDYVATSGTLVFLVGMNSQTVSVTINGDSAIEADESFFVNLSAGANGVVITDGQGLGTISNDDAAGAVSIGDVTIAEGNSGTRVATFTVTRTGGNAAFSVNYATADGSATAGSDYVATSGTLNFGVGVATQTISVTINGDLGNEGNETFAINLSGGTNGVTFTDAAALGTITNDDAAGSITIGDVSISEGDSGTKVASFVVTRAGGTGAFSVDYSTANGTATAGSDYLAASGTLNFGVGFDTQTISVTINGDTTIEAAETFFVNLANGTNGVTIADAQALGVITNDDAAGSVAISDVAIAEGNYGTKIATFTVTRAGGALPFTVNYATSSGTASAGADFIAAAGTISFGFGVTTQTVSIEIAGDTRPESTETFSVTLSGATNGASIFDATGVGTIVDNDRSVRDVNGSRTSDLVFRNVDGSVAVWEMNGAAIVANGAAVLANPGTSWRVVGDGDFFRDGAANLVLQHTNGDVAFWGIMQGTSAPVIDPTQTATLSLHPGDAWKLATVGDFNGDGASDLAFQNTNGAVAVWEMNGLSLIANGAAELANPGAVWKLRGAGDFFGDGKADLLFQNDNGALAYWGVMAGASGPVIDPAQTLALPSSLNPGVNQRVAGVGDFNGDGRADILLQNSVNGDVTLWLMNGAALAAPGATVGSPGAQWKVKSVGDYNADGMSDITLQNSGDGSLQMWLMAGTTRSPATTLAANPGTAWSAV